MASRNRKPWGDHARTFGEWSIRWHRWRARSRDRTRPTAAARFAGRGSTASCSVSVGVADRCRPGATAAADAASSAAAFVATPGPLGPVTVIGDSVLVGASYEPSLPTLLAERGWGPITYPRRRRVHGGQLPTGRAARHRPRTGSTGGGRPGWDPPNVVVNLGSNDVGFCGPERDLQRQHDPVPARRDRPRPHGVVEQDHPASDAAADAERVQPGPRPRRRRAPRPAPLGLADCRRGQRHRDRARRRAPARPGQLPAPIRPDGRRHHRAAGVATRVGGDAPCPSPPDRHRSTRRSHPRSGARHPPAAGGTPRGRRRADDRRWPVSSLPVRPRSPSTSRVPTRRRPGFLTADALRSRRPMRRRANYTPGGAASRVRGRTAGADGDVLRLLLGRRRPDRRPAGGVRGRMHPRGGRGSRRERPNDSSTPARPVGPRIGRRWLPRPERRGVASNLTATGASARVTSRRIPCGGTVPVVSNVNFLAGRDDRRGGVRARRGRRHGVRVHRACRST